MADADRLVKIASIGQDLITTQLTMATQTPSQALEGTWVLGYCFGIFDALAQQADLDDGAEGFSLITLGFLGLFDFGFAVTGDLPFVVALLDCDGGRTEFKDRTCDLIGFRFGGMERTRSEKRKATYERQRMFFYFVHTIFLFPGVFGSFVSLSG